MNSYKELNESNNLNLLTQKVIGCAIEVHKQLGPGLLESAYQQCLAHELTIAGLAFKLQAPMPLVYKNIKLDCGYKIDLLIEDSLILELKAIEQIIGIHEAQIITYMKLAKIPVGLLINFNVRFLKHGIRRLFFSL